MVCRISNRCLAKAAGGLARIVQEMLILVNHRPDASVNNKAVFELQL
jgi:hypothetical protein